MGRRSTTQIPLGAVHPFGDPWHLWPLPIVETQLRARVDRDAEGGSQAGQSLELQLERLPYSIGGAFWATMEVGRLASALAEEVGNRLDGDDGPNQVVVDQGRTLFLRNAVDSYLDIACRGQDAVLAYVTATFSRSLPKSIRRVVKSAKTGGLEDLEPLGDVVIRYWEGTGQRLRQYRDLAQHHAVVASEATVVISEEGPKLSLLLPGNPEEKSPLHWRYGSDGLLAYPFCVESYLDLFGFAYEVLYILAQHLGFTSSFTRMVTLRAPMGPEAPPSHLPPQPQELGEKVLTARRGLKHYCVASYGPIPGQKSGA